MTVATFINKVGFQVDESSLNAVNSTIKGIKNTATQLLGAIGIGFSLSSLNSLAEEFNQINDRINGIIDAETTAKEAQQQILAAANACKSSYSDMADTVESLVNANSSLFPIDDAVTFTEYVNKLGLAAGYTDSEISTMQSNLQRIVASGTASTSDITRMLRSTPALAKQIAEALGVSTEELSTMAEAGQITAETIKTAILSSTDSIDQAFNSLDYSISDALLNIRNQFGFWLDDVNSSLEVTQTLAKTLVSGFNQVMSGLNRARDFLVDFTGELGGTENALKLVAITAGSVVAAIQGQKLLSFIDDLQKGVKTVNLQIVGIVAVIALIALLVEDFIGFLQGKDSIIGDVFNALGIGADNARETISNTLNTIAAFIQNTLVTIRAVIQNAVGTLSGFIEDHADTIQQVMTKAGDTLTAVFNAIATVATAVFTVLFTVAQAVFNALSAFWNRWGSTITSLFSDLWNNLATRIQGFLDIFQGIASFISSVINGDWNSAWNGASQIVAGVIEIISGYLADLLQIFLTIFTIISETVLSILGNIAPGIAERISGIVDVIKEGLQAAVDYITGIPDEAVQWGRDIINGLISGITGAVSGIADAVGGVAETITGFLHFSTPDTGPLTDYESWMPDFMSGLAEGIENNSDAVLNPLRNLVSGMAAILQTGTIQGALSVLSGSSTASLATAAVSAGGNTTNSRNVSQNVEIVNTFNGDKAIQQKAASTMDKSADDITSTLAHALAYAR